MPCRDDLPENTAICIISAVILTADITILFKNSHLIHMERKQNRMHPKNDANSQHNCSGWSRQVHLRTHLETEQKPLRSDTLGLVGAHGVRLHSRYLQYRFVSSSWWSLNDPRRLLGQGFLLCLSICLAGFQDLLECVEVVEQRGAAPSDARQGFVGDANGQSGFAGQ